MHICWPVSIRKISLRTDVASFGILWYLTFQRLITVPIKQRINEEREPRNLKEEGLFVPTYPTVRSSNMNKLHQRLIAEKNTWVFSSFKEGVDDRFWDFFRKWNFELFKKGSKVHALKIQHYYIMLFKNSNYRLSWFLVIYFFLAKFST